MNDIFSKAAEYFGNHTPIEEVEARVLAEREACAKIAETEGVCPETNTAGNEWYAHAKRIAAAIRARGK